MKIIDVTLRDGGHAVDFDWPMHMAREYYKLMSDLEDVDTIELGYWGQTSKSCNTFYNLDFDKVCDVTEGRGLNNVSIMIDYHYCSHSLADYPTEQNEISMIRMCSRKEDMQEALQFGKALKEHTGINVSFNIFNASSYTADEILSVANQVKLYPFDYVYFADTHGSLDLTTEFDKFEVAFDIFKEHGKKVGFHLHDHSGMAMVNYRELLKKGVHSSDTSIRGMGKGSGNLRLEYVVNPKKLQLLAEFILKYEKLLTIIPIPYELITAKYGITDNYALEAKEKHLSMAEFDRSCSKIKGLDRDTYVKELI